MSVSYHLIPYDFETYNFEEFRKEEKECNGEVRWQYGSRKHKFEIGDICYFYCFNLPDMTRRILLRGEISEEDCRDDEGNNCFKISKIRAIRLSDPNKEGEDIVKYSLERLKDDYGIGTVQGKQRLDAEGRHKKLIESLESDIGEENLNQIKKYYDGMTKCAFDGHDHGKHKTFTKPNGFEYFETHHFVQQNICKKSNDQKLIDAVNDERNLIYLCPTCHRKIHLGRDEEKKKMIDFLYKDKEKYYQKVFSDYAKNDGEKDVINWLYSMYKVKEN